MKVVIIAPGLLPVPATDGGAVEQLIDTYIEYNKQNSDDEIIAFSVSSRVKKEEHFINGNVTYIQVPYYSCPFILKGKFGSKIYYRIKYWRYLNSVKRYLKNNTYDLVLIENRAQFVDPIKKVSKKPIYLHLHNEEFISNYNKYKKVPKQVSSILVVSEYISAKIRTIYNCDNVRVIHNGIKINQFKKEVNAVLRKQIRRKYTLGENNFIVVFTGRFTREKGVLELIQAFSKLKENNIELVVIGSSWFGRNNTTPYIRKVEDETKKCRNKITFTGYLNNIQVSEIESVADCAVIPSIWDDPLPLTVIEAMASALPTIVTDSGGIPEMCDSSTSIIIKRDKDLVGHIATAISQLAGNPDLCEEYGNAARRRAEDYFSAHQYCIRLSEALRENY